MFMAVSGRDMFFWGGVMRLDLAQAESICVSNNK